MKKWERRNKEKNRVREKEGKMQIGLVIYFLIILFIGHKLNMNYI